MALMPPDGYPISSYEQLRAAMERAPRDVRSAVAVRNFLMEAQYYRALVASGQMNQNQYLIALEELRKLQKDAAANGYSFTFETSDGHIHHPPVASKAAEVAKRPMAPEGVHFTSHQRVGDEIRDTYIEHIHEMFAGGFIDQDEHDSRLAAMMLAHTKEEMEFLIQDLPSPAGKTGLVVQPEVNDKGKLTFHPVNILIAFTSLSAVGSIATAGAHGIAAALVITVLFSIANIAIITGIKRKK